MIEELQGMAKVRLCLCLSLANLTRLKNVLTMYMQYREKVEHKKAGTTAPKRIIFYRGRTVLAFDVSSSHSSNLQMAYPRDSSSRFSIRVSAPSFLPRHLRLTFASELAALKRACAELGISPKITVIVVGKRHHVRQVDNAMTISAINELRLRFFPRAGAGTDRSGNCKAGTVVDRDVAHPTEFDFYLQSHGGLLGTSRPAHYSVRFLSSIIVAFG